MVLARYSTLKVIAFSCSTLSCSRHFQAAPFKVANATHACPFKSNSLQVSARIVTHRQAPQPQQQHSISRRHAGVIRAAGRQGSPGTSEASMLPNSREEAIAQACAAIAANLPVIKSQKTKKKAAPASAPGFAGETKKLSVEIPVADESLDAAMALAKDMISGLPSPWPNQFTYVTTTSSNNKSTITAANVVSLDACLQDESDSLLGSCIVIVAPKINQVAQVEQLLGRWRGSVCILLNAEWAPLAAEEDLGSIDSVHTAFVRSFQVVYCFMPLLIKAFVVSTQEGAVFRCVGGNTKKSGFSGDGGGDELTGDPWRIFMNKDNSWEPVARMQRRPSSTDVEVSFYNASAANSPLTAGAKFFKGLVNKKK
jgi:Domain of unknown function (DUF1995)